MLSRLRAPGIRRNVRVAATCSHHHYDDDEYEDDCGKCGHLVLLPRPEEQVGDHEEVLVKLVNCVGDRAVEVVFL